MAFIKCRKYKFYIAIRIKPDNELIFVSKIAFTIKENIQSYIVSIIRSFILQIHDTVFLKKLLDS